MILVHPAEAHELVQYFMKPFTFLSLQRLTKDLVLSKLSTAVLQTGGNSFPSNVFRKCSHGAAEI